jgi:beta-galactosidase
LRSPLLVLACLGLVLRATAGEAPLPAGVTATWDPAQAVTEATATRARLCLNGLWRFQPAAQEPRDPGAAVGVPEAGWGYFKVPGCWPGINDYLQHDTQNVFPDPSWKDAKLGALAAAWYQREVTVPAGWSGRRIALSADYLNSYASVYLDGTRAGELRFPGGELEITALAGAGRHLLSLRVMAMPLKAVMLSYGDTSSAKEVKGAVARRGLCGDVWLVSTPAAARIAAVRVATAVRNGSITVEAGLDGLVAGGSYRLQAQISDHGALVHEAASPVFAAGELKDGRFAFSAPWQADKRWDLTTPGNTYQLSLTLAEAGGRALDTALPQRFGVRELSIAGRDFLLNGTRIFLSAVPIDNAELGAAAATYAAAKETMLRLKGFGINMVYTHNYGCEPGTHLAFGEILDAADDVGMLVSLSQPHFGQYDWKAGDADAANGYARHAAFYVRVAASHPSVVFYAMSHNATGYNEDIDPEMMDGVTDNRDGWSSNNVKSALRAEAIVHRLDPERIVYHHSSGDLSALYTVNFYPNFVPIQELSDWFGHWAAAGTKPMFTCEYGAPFTWDWTMYRGWYKGQRSFGSARVPWEFCVAEWDAQFLGDRAFRISEAEKADLRFEARKWRAGETWFRWDYPFEVGTPVIDDRQTVTARYITDNWRSFRGWGLSANSPWEFQPFWRLRDGVERKRVELATDWAALQRPGYSPDYIDHPYERMDIAYQRADWAPTAAGEALLRNNQPLLAFIAGKAAAFTAKDHDFLPGEVVEKQLMVINNSRATVDCSASWTLGLSPALSGSATVTIPTGEIRGVPLRFALPPGQPPGAYELSASVAFSAGTGAGAGAAEVQRDRFTVDVLPAGAPLPAVPRLAVYDPKGETTAALARLGVHGTAVGPGADLSGYDLLVVGKAALAVDGPGPDLARVRAGLRVVVFEQGSAVLERRLGMRIAEYGLRQLFARVPGHPLLAGLADDQLHDWRGEATLLPARMAYTLNNRFNGAPSVLWCGLEVTRLWRCGCRGNLASVLIEKPACGDFTAVLDGGYSLQYSPLLEYREGAGMVVFCQLDVTGRSEDDPAAALLTRNLIAYALAWKPAPRRRAVYAGDQEGARHLAAAGIAVDAYQGGVPAADQVLVLGPGGAKALGADAPAVKGWLAAGGRMLGIGLDEAEANALLPAPVAMKRAEHIAAFFPAPAYGSPLAGVGPADVHNRDPRELPLVTGGALALGDGVIASLAGGNVVLCQLAPWSFDYHKQYNLKRTYRRSAVLLSRLLANLGVAGATPLLARFSAPPGEAGDKRWLSGLYLDAPEEMDDPYRFFGW